MNKLFFDKNVALSAVLVVVIVAIVNKVMPAHVDHVFDLVVSKNRTAITDIHQVRDIEVSKTISIDRINLAEKSRFRHPKLGDLGFGEYFFADIDAAFNVHVAGDYIFYVGSDDGFSLDIDGRQICEWKHKPGQSDRPFETDTCHIRLKEGEHRFKLSYYQGYGNAGLVMSYSNASSNSQYLAGQNSKFISFY